MKTKLLKKLRKIYQLHERNGKFKVFEDRECYGAIYNQTDWISKGEALDIRREKILEYAQRYKTPKKIWT